MSFFCADTVTDAPADLRGKRVVVFGAGYIGGAVACRAAARGARVTALTRNRATAQALEATGVETVIADLAEEAWHARIAGGADLVLNSVAGGGAGGLSRAAVENYRRSYREGMVSVVAWLRTRGGAGAVVYTSSTSVYPQDGGVRVDESAPVDRGGERPSVLVETEDLLRAWSASAGRWTILRLAGIYGPERHHLLAQVRAGEVAGRGEHHLNLIHRDDIVRAIWHAWMQPAAGGEIFNVADDGAARKSEIAAWLAQRLGVPPPRFTGAPASGRRAVTPDRVIANEKLKTALGWRPRYPSFREGYAALLGA
jgi:nucleoside-diphosphate-sugar epimerase